MKNKIQNEKKYLIKKLKFFSIHFEKKWGKHLGIILGVFWCDNMNICNKKLVHDA